MKKMKNIIVFVGMSGSGKTELGKHCKALGIPEIVSHTTRQMRVGEEDGVTYYYVTKEEFDKLHKIEYTEYTGNYYCISADEIKNKLEISDTVFVITDYHGYEQLCDFYKKDNICLYMIYVDINFPVAVERMKARGDSDANISTRILNAINKKELDNIEHADFIIDNTKDLDWSKLQLENILSKIDERLVVNILAHKYGSHALLSAYIKRENSGIDNASLNDFIEEKLYSIDYSVENIVSEAIDDYFQNVQEPLPTQCKLC